MDKTRPSFSDNPLPKREDRELKPIKEDFNEHQANHKISAMISNCLMANFQDQRSIYDLIYELELYGYQSGDKQAYAHALRAKDILQHLLADNLNYLAIMEYYNGMNAIAPNAGDALEVLAYAHASGVLDEELDINKRKRAEYLNNNSIYNVPPTPPKEDSSQHEVDIKPKPVEVQEAISQDGDNELLPATPNTEPTVENHIYDIRDMVKTKPDTDNILPSPSEVKTTNELDKQNVVDTQAVPQERIEEPKLDDSEVDNTDIGSEVPDISQL